MSGYYVAPPLLKIQKKRTKQLIKKGVLKNMWNKVRFKFRRKKKVVVNDEELSD